MGVQVIAKGVDAELYATEYAAPVRRGLEGIFFLNTSLEKSARNYAPGKTQASIVGAPVPSANFLSGKSSSNYIQTDINETAEMTLFSIARALNIPATTPMAPADAPMLITNYTNISPSGIFQWFSSPTIIQAGAAYGADAGGASNPSASVTTDPTRWCLYSTVVKATSIVTTNHTTGATVTRTITNEGTRQLSTRKFRIGSSYLAVAEKELRHKVRPGIEQAMERIRLRGQVPIISEVLQIAIMKMDLMADDQLIEFLRYPRHEIVIEENVAHQLYSHGQRQASRLDAEEA